MISSLENKPEKDDGNKEYKLKLVNGTQERIEQWRTQMQYRLNEGGGEAIYYIGISDSGGLLGITDEDFQETMEILNRVAQSVPCKLTLLSEKAIEDRKIYEFLVREVNETKYVDLKIAIAGSVDTSKSSTLGVLMTGKLDDGRGKARLNVFNFSHEVKTGRTSSIGHHILGFDETGNIVTHTTDFGGKRSWPEIIARSSKVITFFDLCGHERYLKTTILGLTSQLPDLALITIGANMGVTKMTKEHIFLSLSLGIPFAVLITKIDICQKRQNVLNETVKAVYALVKSPPCRRIPIKIKTTEDVLATIENFHSSTIVPIIQTSNVTGEGLNLLTQFLNLVPISTKKRDIQDGVEFYIDTTWTVTGVGTVVGGQLISGTIKTGDKLFLGPNNTGYKQVKIRSIHCKRVPLEEVHSGCYVTLGLQKVDRNTIRRGHVMISNDNPQIASRVFEAEVTVMKSHSTTIKVGYEPVVHTRSIRQTAKIIDIWNKINLKTGKKSDEKILRTGDRATVRFRFSYSPEYIKAGYRILLAEGRLKVIGKINLVL